MRQKNPAVRKWKSRFIILIMFLSLIAALIPLLSILYTILAKGLTALTWEFLTTLPAPVGEKGGMSNAIVGSFILLGLASLFAVPIGIGTGIYVAEYSERKLARTVRFFIDVLTGVPAIVMGVFIYTLVVLPTHHFSAIAGALSLGIIMIPIVVRTTEEAFKMVPRAVTEAGIALGISRWRVTLFVVLKACWSGVATGILLAIARVAGEAAPLLFTAFNNREYGSILEPISSLPTQIFTYAIAPFEEWHHQAWAGALVLVGMILILNIGVRFTLWLRSRKS